MQRTAARSCLGLVIVLALGGCAELDHLVHVFLPRPAPSYTDTEFRLDERRAATITPPARPPAAVLARHRPDADFDQAAPQFPVESPAADVGSDPASGTAHRQTETALTEAADAAAATPVTAPTALAEILRALDDLVDQSMRLQESLMRLDAARAR